MYRQVIRPFETEFGLGLVYSRKFTVKHNIYVYIVR